MTLDPSTRDPTRTGIGRPAPARSPWPDATEAHLWTSRRVIALLNELRNSVRRRDLHVHDLALIAGITITIATPVRSSRPKGRSAPTTSTRVLLGAVTPVKASRKVALACDSDRRPLRPVSRLRPGYSSVTTEVGLFVCASFAIREKILVASEIIIEEDQGTAMSRNSDCRELRGNNHPHPVSIIRAERHQVTPSPRMLNSYSSNRPCGA